MTEEWYWDIESNRAVPASERGSDRRTLGPYPSREAAENWRETVEARNEEWNDADEEWENPGEETDR